MNEDPKAIGIACREMRKLGYGMMIWKSDQESSIVALKHRMRMELGEGFDIRM